jgi:hypothetical protein
MIERLLFLLNPFNIEAQRFLLAATLLITLIAKLKEFAVKHNIQ